MFIFAFYVITPCFITPFLSAQETIDQKIASLERQLQAASGPAKIKILNDLGTVYYSKSPQKCIEYGEQALELCKQYGDYRKKARALKNIGLGHQQLGDYDKAVAYLTDCLELCRENDDTEGSLSPLVNLGIVYRSAGKYQKSLEYYNRAMEIFERSGGGSKKKTAILAGNIGNVYISLDNFKKALEYQLKALSISEEIGDTAGVMHAKNNIGLVYKAMKRFDKALEYFQAALTMARESGSKYVTASALNSIGGVYRDGKKDYPNALIFLLEGLKLSREMGSREYISVFLDDIGMTHFEGGDLKAAADFYRASLDIKEAIGDKPGMVISMVHIAQIKNDAESFALLERALALAEETKAKAHKREIYLRFSTLYEGTGDYKKALEYHKAYFKINEEMLDEAGSKQVAEMQTRYETLKKEKEILTLKKNNEIREKSRNLLVVGLILALVTIVLLIRKFLYLFTFWKKEKYIGHYRLMEELGYGGMAKVFKAHSIRDKTDITAIKVLKEEYFDDDEYRERFKTEANIVDKLDHPNIVNIRERGTSHHKLFIVMEYLPGETLRRRIDAGGKIDLPVAYHIMEQIAEALAFIHRRNIFHRDLKPSNVMLIRRGEDAHYVKLLDFGLAKGKHQTRITGTGVLMGTIGYMSPEQLTGLTFSFPSDIFSLGVIFYEILTGAPAFPGDTPTDIMKQILEKSPVLLDKFRPEVPVALSEFIMSMIHKEPDRRPTAIEVRDFFQAQH